MLIKDMPEDQVKIGLRVWNHKKTRQGTVTNLDPESRNGLDVEITWDGPGQDISVWWAYQLELEVVV